MARPRWSCHEVRSRGTSRLPCYSVSFSTPYSFIFNALLKATGVGHKTISGLLAPARGFADDLVLVTRSAADISRLL